MCFCQSVFQQLECNAKILCTEIYRSVQDTFMIQDTLMEGFTPLWIEK